MSRSRIIIRYKSGAEISATVESLTVEIWEGKITKIDWNNMKPNPLHIGIDDIESVWEVG
jgi:hypothetical protein